MTSRQETTISANADTWVPSLATQRGEKQLQIPVLLTHALGGHYHSYQESSQQLLSQRLQELLRRELLILTIVCLDTVFTTGRHHVTQAAARQIARFILFNLAAGYIIQLVYHAHRTWSCIIQLVYRAHRGWSRAGWLYRLLGGDILPVCGLTRSQLAEHIFAIVFEGLPNALLYNI